MRNTILGQKVPRADLRLAYKRIPQLYVVTVVAIDRCLLTGASMNRGSGAVTVTCGLRSSRVWRSLASIVKYGLGEMVLSVAVGMFASIPALVS